VRIVFWGTPAFALPTLRAISGEGHEVVGVVTRPDRPAGRGRRLSAPPVKAWAEGEGVPVLQPERPAGADFLEQLRELAPDLSVVVAYGKILGREVLDVPTQGSINVHASLLPALRGAAPIQWAIIRGEAVTGVTIMRMVEAMDAGPILLQVEEPIGADETAVELTSRLSELGAEALVEALALLEIGEATEREQDDDRATFAPRIEREDARIDWTLAAAEVVRWIRGTDDVPGPWSALEAEEVKLFRPRPDDELLHGVQPGTVLIARDDPEAPLLIAAGRGAVWIREVQPAGKRRMSAAEWVRGRSVNEGDLFV
jgi:methionyl-tRNA formyltransferase